MENGIDAMLKIKVRGKEKIITVKIPLAKPDENGEFPKGKIVIDKDGNATLVPAEEDGGKGFTIIVKQ